MIILGIESSCDDTSVALVEATAPTSPCPLLGQEGGFRILAEKTASQIEIHKKYGGVVPEIAGRMHAENIGPLIQEVINTYHVSHNTYQNCKPDVIAVTAGPGLITGLMVGVEAAKTLAYLWKVPVVGVNHVEGHIYSPVISRSPDGDEKSFEEKPKQNTTDNNKPKKIFSERSLTTSVVRDDIYRYPALALIASGGHTELILAHKQGDYDRIGATLDDAAGECFDKVAKLLGFDYPGGPKISQFAETGNPDAIKFPRPMLNKNNLDFSFAGLKTSALYWLKDNAKRSDTCYVLRDTCKKDFCASFEQAIIDVLVGKTLKAVEKYKPKSVILAGGVSANKKLRATLAQSLVPCSMFHAPSLAYAMDNAAMIAVAGYYHAIKKDFTPWQKLKANPEWEIAR